MASTAIKAIGIDFRINGTTVAGVLDFEGPAISNDLIEVTNQQSTAKEYIAALKENGDIKFNLNFVPGDSSDTAVIALANTGDRFTWELVWPQALQTWTGEGIISEFSPKAKIKDQLQADVTIKPTNAVTIS